MFNRRRSFAPKRYQAPRRKAYGKGSGYKKRPRTLSVASRSFARDVKKANISAAPEKQLSVCIADIPLRHNLWSEGKSVHLDSFSTGENVMLFENMFSQIRIGLQDDRRVSEQIFVDRLKMRLFFTADVSHPALSYRIVVYMTPNSLPTSTGEPTLLDSNVSSTHGYNHLLRTVDKRSNHVLFEKLISPNQMGGLTGVQTSYMEEINCRLKKTITYQSPAHTYGAKGTWTNLHVAILAYDPTLHKVVVSAVAPIFAVTDESAAAVAYRAAIAASTVASNQMIVDELTEDLGLGIKASAVISYTPVAAVACKYTIYFKKV